jgi:ABC-type nitrate/sulfonate/bicarbonate transport system substrate-binding protein
MIADAENAASTLNPPFSFEAAKAGKRSLGRVIDLIGPYQASGGFVMREWAKANASLLERYIAGYVEALRYALDPAHRDESVALLGERLKLTPELAEATYQALVAPGFGLTPDARLDLEGFKAVLALRAEIEGQWGGTPPAPDRYLDLSYYERALARLGR